jgi:hypothetical protein
MARPIEQQLLKELINTEFVFIQRGVIEINEIYDVVKVKFNDLCDDNYLCSENCKNDNNEPEWKHTVLRALTWLPLITKTINIFGIRGFWEFN